MRRVLARRDLRRYLAAQALAVFGTSSLFLANGIWAKSLTGSSSAAGLVFFAFSLPILLSPISGAVVDRVRRRPLLVGANFASAAVVLMLLLVRGEGQLWIIYAVAFTHGCVFTLITSAQSAFLRVLVPDDDDLADANAVLQTTRQFLRLLSPIGGAGLYAAFGGGAVATMTAAMLVLAGLTMLTVRVPEPRPVRVRQRWTAEFAAGTSHMVRTTVLRQLVVAVGAALLVIGFIETLIFAVVDEGLNKSPSFVGVIELGLAAGSVAGGLTAAPVLRRLRAGPSVGLGLIFFAVGAALFAVPVVPVVIAGHVIVGLGIPWVVVSLITTMQRLTPQHLQGRVYSAVEMCIGGPQTLSIALGAALASVIDYRILIAAMSVTMLCCALYIMTRREQRLSLPVRAPVPSPELAPAAGTTRAPQNPRS